MPAEHVSKKRLKLALRGNRSAIVRVFKANPAAFGDAQPVAAIAKAKAIMFRAAERRSLSTAEQAELDAAEQFLSDLADALVYVPTSVRSKAILWFCATTTNHLELAKPIIVATPRRDRQRQSTQTRLATETRLDPEVVKVFLDSPRTGTLGLARTLTGRKFGVTAEHVRKLQAKHRDWNIRGNLVLLASKRKSK